mmetsp:Transcript_49838/g.161260  ORF Transcript_49838/g.161260 Transcript_49838/m.161260 type:complete len:271 (+) Transcript_49838:504-1316(+)
MHLRAVEGDLRRVVKDPFAALHLLVRLHALLHGATNRHAHAFLKVPHPHLHGLLVGDDRSNKLNQLSLRGDHAQNLVVRIEDDLGYRLKDLRQEGLHACGVLGLGQNLKQLVVGQEVKAGKTNFLRLQVVLKTFLDHVEVQVALPPLLEQAFSRADVDNLRVVPGLHHLLSPCAIHVLEALALRRQLPHDVVGREDRFQVHPSLLTLQPLLKRLGNAHQTGVPVVDVLLEGALEGGEHHGLRRNDVLVEQHHGFAIALQDVGVGLAVLFG